MSAHNDMLDIETACTIRSMTRAGVPVKVIAWRVGVGKTTVYRYSWDLRRSRR